MHMGGELNQNAPFTMTPQMNKPKQPQHKMPMMNMGMRGGGKVNKRSR